MDADTQFELSVARGAAVEIRSVKPGWLHWGVNGWQPVPEALHPSGSRPGPEGKATQSPLQARPGDGVPHAIVMGPFDAAAGVASIEFTFQYADGSWGQDHKLLFV